MISRNEFLDLVKNELPFWPRGKIAEIHSVIKQYVLNGMDVMNLKQFLATTEAYQFLYHKLALPFYTSESDALSKASAELLNSFAASKSSAAVKPIFLSKLTNKVHQLTASNRSELKADGRQLQHVASSVSTILRNGVAEPGKDKIERLLQRFGAEALTNTSASKYSLSPELSFSKTAKPAYTKPRGKRYGPASLQSM